VSPEGLLTCLGLKRLDLKAENRRPDRVGDRLGFVAERRAQGARLNRGGKPLRCGMTLFIQGYQDWDRYEARERGEAVAPIDPELDRKRLSEEIETALQAEDQGFDSMWTVEHHVSPYTMITNPIQLLTFFAGATTRMDMGTMVVVLPWHHPLRIAEDITMLQYALRGRTPYIGFGRGAARREFRQLGFNMNESQERFAEAIQVVKLALTEEAFTFSGEHYQFDNVTMRPRPHDPHAQLDAFHFSWGSPSSAPVGAKYGLKPLIIPQRAWSEYHADLASFASARGEVGLPPVRPRIHMCAYVGETEREAIDNAQRYIPEYSISALRNYELTSNHFATTKGYEHYAAMASAVTSEAMGASYLANHVWGTPDQCIEKLRGIADAFHPEEFMLVFRYGSMPRDVAEKSIRLFAAEVLPAVHEMRLEDPVVYDEAAVA
jgi:alkanesulfonate monooxygenase SsuD/methylene tetrahydromethanopterin reductase-like flavin-dependent oxidoreductase (luciferase family)